MDYLKVGGCGPKDYYPTGYKAMGAALGASGRAIDYSCSWPAYSGDDESTKPFQTYIDIGCTGWRNWHDVECSMGSVLKIIDHWGDYGKVLQPYGGPGHWHDMDMLLVGALSTGRVPGDGSNNPVGFPCISDEQGKTQMAIWCISSSPLIMGNDLRNMTQASKATLLNRGAIAVSQDPLGHMGIRLTGPTEYKQVWAKTLTPTSGGKFKAAVCLFARESSAVGAISFNFSMIPKFSTVEGPVTVTDIWSGHVETVTTGFYTAKVLEIYSSAFITIEAN